MIVNSKMIFGLCFVVSLLVVALIHFYETHGVKEKIIAKYDLYKEQVSHLKIKIIKEKKVLKKIAHQVNSSSQSLKKYNYNSGFPVIIIKIGDKYISEFGIVKVPSFKESDIIIKEDIKPDTAIIVAQEESSFLSSENKDCLFTSSLKLDKKKYEICHKLSTSSLIPILSLFLLVPMSISERSFTRKLKIKQENLKNLEYTIDYYKNLLSRVENKDEYNIKNMVINYDIIEEILGCYENNLKDKKLELECNIENIVDEYLINEVLFQRAFTAIIDDSMNYIQDEGRIDIFITKSEEFIMLRYKDDRFTGVKERENVRLNLLKKELGLLKFKKRTEGTVYEVLFDAEKNKKANVIQIDFQK